MRMITSLGRGLLQAFFFCLVTVPGFAQTVPPEPYFRHSDYSDIKPSPSGKLIGALVPQNGRRAIGVVDLVNLKSSIVAKMDEGDIVWFEWVNDDRLVLTVADLQGGVDEQVWGGLFAIDRDGSHFREIAPTWG